MIPLLNEFDQIVENQSDDGEPKGSSGPPTLAVLRGEELLETAVIIVRYFGGIKLGVGGLIRAYGRSVHLGLEEARRNNFISAYIKQINSEYSIVIQNLGKLEHFLKNYESILIEKNFKGLEVEFIIGATRSEHGQINDFLMKIKY